MMKWNKLRDEVHKIAVDHGWWEKPLSFSEIIVMCHSELSEAVEEYRAERPMVYHGCYMDGVEVCDPGNESCAPHICPPDCMYYIEKPEGVAVELADCVLRILDYMGQVKGNVDGIVRHMGGFSNPGPGKPLPDLVAGCHYLLSGAYAANRQAEMLGRKRAGRKIKLVNPAHICRERAYERQAKQKMVGCILDIMQWAKSNGVDMEAVIKAKNEYNKTREYRHGGKRL